MRILIRITLFGLVIIVVTAVAVIGGGVIWLRTPWGHAYVRDQIVTQLGKLVDGEVRVSDVDGDIVSGITLHDFALVGSDGVALVDAASIRVAYELKPLFDQRIVVGRVEISGARFHLARADDGQWNFRTLFKPRPPTDPDDPPGWGSSIQVRTIDLVDSELQVSLAGVSLPGIGGSTNRFEDLSGTVRLEIDSRDRNRQRYEVENVAFRVNAPAMTVERLDAALTWTADSLALRGVVLETGGTSLRVDGVITRGVDGAFAIDIEAPRIDLAEVRAYVPMVRIDGAVAYTGRIVGPAGNPTLEIDTATVTTRRSSMDITGAVRTLADATLDLTVDVHALSPEDVRAYIGAYPFEQLLSGRIEVDGVPARLGIDARLRAPAGGLTVDGTLRLGRGPFGYDVLATSQSLHVGELIGRPHVDIVLTGAYRIDGEGTSDADMLATVVGRLERSRVYRWELLDLTTAGRFEGRTYVADTIAARMTATVARGHGRFGLARAGEIDARFDLTTDAIEEVWPPWSDLGGRIAADIRLLGTYEGFEARTDVVATDFSFKGATVDSFTGDVRLTGIAGPVFRMQGDGEASTISLAGIPAIRGDLQMVYEAGRLSFTGAFDHPERQASSVVGSVAFGGPQPIVEIERFVYGQPDSRWQTTGTSRLRIIGDGIEADQFTLEREGQSIRLDGAFDRGPGSELTVAVDNADLKDIARFLGKPSGDWVGSASLSGRLSGTRAAPILALDGAVSEGMIFGFRFVRIQGDVEYEDRLARVDWTITTPREGHNLRLVGAVPVDFALVSGVNRLPDRPVDLEIHGENTDLTLLEAFMPGLYGLEGPVDVAVTVSGSSFAPRFEGQAVVRGGSFGIVISGVRYTEIDGRLNFTNDRIEFERLTGRDRRGEQFTASGTIAMENLRLGEFDLVVEADHLLVLDRDRQDVLVTGIVRVGGDFRTPILSGSVTVDRATYRLPERSKKNIIDLDRAVLYVDIPGAADALRNRSPSLWDRSRVEFDVRVRDNAILSSQNARIEISGDLSLFKTSGQRVPAFSGTLDVRRGFYEEFGRRFTIERGDVFFFGTPELNPGMNVVATRLVPDVPDFGDVEIRILLGGTLRDLTIDLESVPAFDRSEIISIALFGRPSPAPGQQGQFQETVTNLLAGTAAVPKAALTRELNLDLLEVTQRSDEVGDTATLFRIGKYLNPDVYVTFEQEFGGTREESAVALRYQLSDRVTVQANAGTNRQQRLLGGVDLFWEYTY